MKWAMLILVMLCSGAFAHPGSGIVVSDEGTVYFCDVGRETIWRIDAGGEAAAHVRGTWTHSLALDADGLLYYEREESVGGAFPCSLWRVGADGEPERLIEAQLDRRMFSGPGFVLGRDGSVYYPHSERVGDDEWRVRIIRRTAEGEVSVFAGGGDGALYLDGDADTATIRIITAMTMGADGVIWFADRDHVRRVPTLGDRAGHVETVASGLIDADPKDPPLKRGPSTTINRLFGIAVDDRSRALVAYQAGRRVLRVDREGVAEVVFRSEADWSPIGVAARGEAVYVLEVHDDSIERLRVRRLDAGGGGEVLAELR